VLSTQYHVKLILANWTELNWCTRQRDRQTSDAHHRLMPLPYGGHNKWIQLLFFEWCGSSYSICVRSLKFVDLPVPKIWPIFGHGVNRSGDLDLWPFDLWMVSRVIRANFQLSLSFHSRLMVRHGTDRQTDKQRAAISASSLPYNGGRGLNKWELNDWKLNVKKSSDSHI